MSAFIGGLSTFTGTPPSFRDQQGADDFVLTTATRLTSVTVDFAVIDVDIGAVPHPTIMAPAGGFLVEIFSNVGGKPSEVPAVTALISSFQSLGSFPASTTLPSVFTPALENARTTFALDVSAENFVLEPGTWWLSVQAIDETPFGQDYKWAGRRSSSLGFGSHFRSGGVDHGNGYPGNSGFDWAPSAGSRPDPRELSFALEGNAIPAPGIAALGLVGLAGLRRRRLV